MNFRFTVRKSAIQGKGLFTLDPIPRRRKFGELTGERISLREAARRARERKIIAIVELDDHAIDATHGNDFRFMNHSCRPNSFMRRTASRVEFYALRNIRPGEELTCNYGETQHEGTLRCGCGAEGCRGML
jgi:SET domain-containing protein